MTSSENIITAEKLSKSYRIWENPSRRLINPILGKFGQLLPGGLGQGVRKKATLGFQDFFALQGVDFELKRGEAIGIVGRNGAGKSTLLQLIARTLQPSSGSITVHGRVAALLELGAGFNIDFTGRENVFLSGAILGLNQKEMESRFDEVAAFADIGDFIDQPVKTYSSGMMMRLAFAVNTCVDPDILIVDEALSVGDAPFQSKCFKRLRHLIDQGVSLLFVSHDLGTVRSICSRALWLKDGQMEMWGDAKVVAKAYEKFCWAEQGVALDEAPSNKSGSGSDTDQGVDSGDSLHRDNDNFIVASSYPSELFKPTKEFIAFREKSRFGTRGVSIDNVLILDEQGAPSTQFNYAEQTTILVLFTLNNDVDSDCIVSFLLRDLKGNSIIATQDVTSFGRIKGKTGQRYIASTTFPLPLHHQKYVLHTAVFGFKDGTALKKDHYDFTNAVLWDVIDEAAFIEVSTCSIMPLSGPVHLDSPVTISEIH